MEAKTEVESAKFSSSIESNLERTEKATKTEFLVSVGTSFHTCALGIV